MPDRRDPNHGHAAMTRPTGPAPRASDEQPPRDRDADEHGATATATRPAPSPPKPRRLPPYRVLLHNDDVNDMLFVAGAIVELARLTRPEALERMLEAHQRGLALLLVTHREHAELLEEQFQSKGLTVTIEPDV
jgi:ATP-dependent Clp protease adaptor protein ClpS